VSQTEELPAAAGRAWLPPAAAAYFLAVTGTTLALAAALLTRIGSGAHEPWWSFVVLAGLAAAAQAFVVLVRVTNAAYAVSIVFLVAAALLLPPELALLVPFVQFVPDWLRARREWTVQSFNICQSALVILAAGGVFRTLEAHLALGVHARFVVAATVAALGLVVLNHLLVDTMIHLARGRSYRELGLLDPSEYLPDLVLAGIGVCFVGLWRSNPALVPFALTPLALVQRSLSVPALEAEARVDPKTGLFNARHFNKVFQDELARSHRHERPLALLMIDLDLLREINNKFGHLAGDAVIRGIAEVFREHLRHYDVPSRFGGEEYSVLLPETSPEQALEIAERIRATVASHRFMVETVAEPIQATVSVGVACYPGDATDQTELVHQADLAVYRAKLQGRNRVVAASAEFELMTTETALAPAPTLEEDGDFHAPLAAASQQAPAAERRRRARPQPLPRLRLQSRRLVVLVAAVTALGIAAGGAALVLGSSSDWIAIAVLAVLAGGAQALALELEDGTLSVGTAAIIAAAGLVGGRGILVCAIAAAVVELAARRVPPFQCVFDLGVAALAGIAALGVFTAQHAFGSDGLAATFVSAVVAGLAVYIVSSALLTALAVTAAGARWRSIWRERFAWLLPHHVVYGAFAAAMILGYRAVGVYGLLVFVLPLVLVRQTQAHHLVKTQRTQAQLRDAAQTIREQNVSLELANRLLRERSAAAMETLTATVDSRDAATHGHSRRVQELSLAMGRQLGLSEPELELLGHAALFHDIGKLAVPDAVLLKPERLSEDEWELMRTHVEEGARIIGRLGFLADAVPAIRHHHEHWDGTGYPDRLAGEDIPLGARVIHVAAAVESMLTDRRYREARSLDEVLAELRNGVGSQFCARSVGAAEAVLSGEDVSDAVEALRRRLASPMSESADITVRESVASDINRR
jgi:diguanylate cyclase (GGDEF)-like protein/putative nucleotidyltransferase with HDIG domain